MQRRNVGAGECGPVGLKNLQGKVEKVTAELWCLAPVAVCVETVENGWWFDLM